MATSLLAKSEKLIQKIAAWFNPDQPALHGRNFDSLRFAVQLRNPELANLPRMQRLGFCRTLRRAALPARHQHRAQVRHISGRSSALAIRAVHAFCRGCRATPRSDFAGPCGVPPFQRAISIELRSATFPAAPPPWRYAPSTPSAEDAGQLPKMPSPNSTLASPESSAMATTRPVTRSPALCSARYSSRLVGT